MFGFKKKYTYKVTYHVYGYGDFTTFLKASGLADIQKQLEQKERPFHVQILEAIPL